jgi:hypothetical protein
VQWLVLTTIFILICFPRNTVTCFDSLPRNTATCLDLILFHRNTTTATCSDSFSQKYSNCSCVHYTPTAEELASGEVWEVQEGKCESSCPYLPAFMPVFAIIMVGIFITSMPALTATLRSGCKR